ncbi:MAG: hypothetical protein IJ981_03105 [Clostridia bacterium]|nr:hypothetical protein [Clostridia bacterium]
MKKIFCVFLALLVLMIPTTVVMAGETETPAPEVGNEVVDESVEEIPDIEETPTEQPQTEISGWFQRDVKPYIWQFLTAFLGGSGGVAAIIAFALKKVNELQKAKENYETAIAELTKKYDESLEKMDAKFDEMKKENAQLKEMLLVAFCNDAKLVANGHAKKIVEIAKGVKNENDN